MTSCWRSRRLAAGRACAGKHAQRHGEAMAALGRLQRRADRRRSSTRCHRRRRPEGDLSRRQHAERPGLSRRDDRQRAEPHGRTARRPMWPRRPDWVQRASARYYEESETRHYPVHARLANHLIAALIEREFDVVVGQCVARRRRRGACLRLRPSAPHERAAIPVVPVVPQHLLPAEPALAAALLQARPGDSRSDRGLSGRPARRRRRVGWAQPLHGRRGARRRSHPRAPREGCGRPAGPAARSSSTRATPRSATGSAPAARWSISTCAG